MEAESFDKKIRELLDGQDFPYQEADWHKAQVLLQKKRKRRALGWLWLLPAIAIGTAWWAFSTQPTGTQTQNSVSANEASAIVGANIASPTPANPQVESARATERKATEQSNRTFFANNPRKGQQQNVSALAPAAVPSTSVDTTPNKYAAFSFLPLRKMLLSRSTIAQALPEKRPNVSFVFDRQPVKTPPTLSLGFWTATQPSLTPTHERGATQLNIQGGAFAGVQWENGLYGQWLSGMQLQGLNNWTYTNTAIRYDFGEEKTTKTLQLRDYWSLQNTLLVGYAKNKHRLYAALTYQQYLFSRYQLTTSTERQDAPTQTITTTGNAPWPQAQLPRWLPAVGYQFDINPAFCLGIQYQFRTPSARSTNLAPASPWQLHLQYHLFQRQLP